MNRIAVLILAAALLLGFVRDGFAEIYGQADLSYQNTKTTTESSSTEDTTFTQAYTLGFFRPITNTINLRADIRVTETEQNGEKSETIYPVFTFNYAPPSLYYFTFNYTRIDIAPSEGDRLATSNISSSFSMPLEKWPTVVLNFNRSTNQDYLDPHTVDNISMNYGLNSNYAFEFLETDASVNYSFIQQNSEDKVANTRREAPTHSVTVDIARYFFDKKVRFSTNFGYSWTENTNTSLEGESRFEQTVAAEQGLYKDSPDPLTGALDPADTLRDTDTQNAAKATDGADITLNKTGQNIGLKFTTAQSLEKINIYVKADSTQITTVQNQDFDFQLYTSNDGVTWTSQGKPAFSFDTIFSRFVLTFAETSARFFKVVNNNFLPQSIPVAVTEMEALGFAASTPTEVLNYTVTREFAGFNLVYFPAHNVTIGYNLNFDHTAQSLNNSDSKSVSHSGNLAYQVFPKYLNVSVGFSKTKNTATQGATTPTTTESESDSYTLSLSSTPLETLNANATYGHFSNSTDGSTESTTDSIGTNASMRLYRGVDLGVGTSFSSTKNFADDSTTDSVNNYANLTLVPRRDLVAVFNASTSSSETQNAGETSSSSSNTLSSSFSYTPTRKMYVTASFTLEPTISQSYAVTWLPTRTVQVAARYGTSDDVRNVSSTVSWAPITRLSIFLGYSLTQSTDSTQSDTSSVFTRASLRF